ncbi:corepressor interacting with RBPJ 1 [Vespula pensylvanica]|uniref:corepressor interacting with RBPJ 1 n=1 Tax=Vespula pensylvanica TaxID=30213 RepID=UPI001CBA48FD|nr:corepressor interacting with RBPJ 1 [Vespula pensylvanica]
MGKGFNNYMCKKFFHPASRDNLKRVWMAEQQAEAYKKKQEELRVQYEKEQDLHNNKALLSKESKDKLSVNFMYEPPPGAKKEREKEDNEPEYKFEWQRKYNAPRESYCKGDSEIRDQPFGIQVRNVRCIKCHKWGHINTDKECPLYSQAMSVVMANNSNIPQTPDALTLVQQMREDGLALKKSALDAQQHLRVPGHEHLMVSDDEENSEITFLKTLSKQEKKKLLKKLQKLEKKNMKIKHKKLKKRKVRNSKKSHASSSSSSSSSSSNSNSGSSSDTDCKNSNNSISDDSSSSSSDSSSTESNRKKWKHKRKSQGKIEINSHANHNFNRHKDKERKTKHKLEDKYKSNNKMKDEKRNREKTIDHCENRKRKNNELHSDKKRKKH